MWNKTHNKGAPQVSEVVRQRKKENVCVRKDNERQRYAEKGLKLCKFKTFLLNPSRLSGWKSKKSMSNYVSEYNAFYC